MQEIKKKLGEDQAESTAQSRGEFNKSPQKKKD